MYHKSDRDVRYLDNVLEFGDQFISTGDIVRIGADRSYYFVDRSGDTFRSERTTKSLKYNHPKAGNSGF